MLYTTYPLQAICRLIVLLLVPGALFSQRSVPADYPGSSTVNYVRSWDAKAPEASATTLITRPLRDVQQTTQYFDGLGRPLQTVVKQGSYPTGGTAVDMVSMVEYDAFGREAFKYLPTAANNTGGNTSISDGKFKLNPFEQQEAFYNSGNANSPITGQGETWLYGVTTFEASPLNRVQEEFAPGNSWASTSGPTFTDANRRAVRTKYYANTATDAVRIWKVNAATLGSWGTYQVNATLGVSGVYGAGELYKTISVDENNYPSIEFKDKEGRLILKKAQHQGLSDNGSGAGYLNWICTYYIYDDLGNLRCVVQPEGVKALEANAWAFTTTILDHQCFRYEYDGRNRMIMKKVPGVLEANATWMVYDARDRLVMTQDGKQRVITNKPWMVTSYDELNRPIQTGLLVSNYAALTGKTFNQVLTAAAASTAYPFSLASPPSGSQYTLLTQTGYDHYDDMAAAGSPLTKDFDNTYSTSTYMHTTYNTTPLYAQQPVQSLQTEGLPTWTKVKTSSTTTYFEYAVNIYDDKGRIIQTKRRNYTGGTSVITTQYNWAGQALRIVNKHHKALATTHVSIVVTDMSYDDLGRLVLTQKKIRNNLVNGNALPATWTSIATNEYDALGQLKTKKLGDKPGAPAGTPLAKLDYTYNIRGWLLSVNKGYMNSSNADQYFAMELGYDKDLSMGTNYVEKQYNGNIGSILWKGESDQQRRKLEFGYDGINRLRYSVFTQYTSGSGASAVFDVSAGVYFSSVYAYDYNGNFIEMAQTGLVLNTSPVIDGLTYTYEPGSNRLQRVTDNPGLPYSTINNNGKLGDFKDGNNAPGTADYDYNENGSLKMDNNKDISSISYHSMMELPSVITTSKGTIEYVYTVDGAKLWKKIIDNSGAGKTINVTTKYVEDFVYESKSIVPTEAAYPDYSDKLQFASHEEGRIRGLYNNATSPNTLTGFAYDYFIKDHLGNVRVVLTSEVKQDIYPAATLEGDINTDGSPNAAYKEKDYYTIETGKIVPKTDATGITDYVNHNGNPPANPNPNSVTTANSAKLYKLKAAGTTPATGLGITLKVMAGDKIDIFGKSYYFENNAGGSGANIALHTIDILTGLLGGPTGGTAAAAHGGVTGSQLNDITEITGGVGTLLTSQTTESAGAPLVPKAYINYIFFDEQFQVVKDALGNIQAAGDKVGTNGVVKPHTITGKTALKSGYVYIYVSNESPVDVFFDNLQVIHTRGAMLEETHYYPFGLTMAGISYKALNGLAENRIKFQGQELASKEFADGTGLDWYEFKWRMHDVQIGRFFQVDPLADKYVYNSPYAFSENKVTGHVELEGLESAPSFSSADIFRSAGITSSTDPIQWVKDAAKTLATPEPWVGAAKILGPVLGGALLGILTSGVGSGSVVTSEVGETSVAANEMEGLTTLQRNVIRGKQFEQEAVAVLASEGRTDMAEQVMVKANGNGVRTRLDLISKDRGRIVLDEMKSSATAPLTDNQKLAFPSIEQTGGVVVGKGKPGTPGGTQIPPTRVNIIRPDNLRPVSDATTVRQNNIYLPIPDQSKR